MSSASPGTAGLRGARPGSPLRGRAGLAAAGPGCTSLGGAGLGCASSGRHLGSAGLGCASSGGCLGSARLGRHCFRRAALRVSAAARGSPLGARLGRRHLFGRCCRAGSFATMPWLRRIRRVGGTDLGGHTVSLEAVLRDWEHCDPPSRSSRARCRGLPEISARRAGRRSVEAPRGTVELVSDVLAGTTCPLG
jgi:hypothetical protein